MDRYPYDRPPRWWEPRPNRTWARLWRPVRRYQQLRSHRISKIDIEGLEHVRKAIRNGHGVLITPNHASHGDCYLLLESLLRLPCPFYIMIAWQVFHLMQHWQRRAYQHHGCFSVDREGKDLRAFRFAVRTLATSSDPLVVFPEGEVYHLNDVVTPFRDGTFLIASTAIKRSQRPIACIPCALKYHYLADPSESLSTVVEAMEQRLDVSGRDSLTLADRVERLQMGMIALREREYLGSVTNGDMAQRRDTLANVILNRAAERYGLNAGKRRVPERVKEIRQHLIENADLTERLVAKTFEDVHVAIQLYSYRLGYVLEKPTWERLAETVDKLEEDVLGARTATIRGTRRGTIRFGQPVMMDRPLDRNDCQQFGETIRDRIQGLLDAEAVVGDR